MTFDELKKAAEAKGYCVEKLDRGSHHVPSPGVHDRYEIWLSGKYQGPCIKKSTRDFSAKVGIGPTLEEAIEEARKSIEQRASHAA